MAGFSLGNLPTLGTWVTIAPPTIARGRARGSQARRSNASRAPALVSSVSIDGTATVLYPNNFVLMHGFKGEPLKRVTDLALEHLRPFAGTGISLQILEKALLTAVKADAQSRQLPAAPRRRPRVAAEPAASRSRSRSPAREEAQVPAPETPQHRVRAGSCGGDSRCLSRRDTDEKVEAAPAARPPVAALGAKAPGPAQALDAKAAARRGAALASLVGRALRAGGRGRLARGELEAALLSGGFEEKEIAVGLQRLDASNKILLMDGLAFLV